MPTCSITTKSSSLPIGAAGSKILDSCIARFLVASSSSARLLSASLTLLANALAFSRSEFFSSPFALATALDNVFCSARSVSKSLRAKRRASSLFKTLSTIVTSSPRPFCDARTTSGLSRKNLMSIICRSFLSGMNQGSGCLHRSRVMPRSSPLLGYRSSGLLHQ